MTASGYRDLRYCSDIETLIENLKHSVPPDLVITDTKLPGGDIFSIISDIRKGILGGNPFVPVIMLTWDTSADIIRNAAQCGVDHILAAPISPSDLFARVSHLVSKRKPFVVTSDYIGPDRRQNASRDGTDGIPLIDVPNTLRSKANGEKIDTSNLKAVIREAMREINEQRLVRHSYQINFLIGIILPAYEAGNITPEIQVHVARLSDVSQEVQGRLANSSFKHVGEMCNSLAGVAQSIRTNWQKPNKKDIELLEPLSQAILAGFNPDKNSGEMSSEITNMLSKFSGKANEEARRQIEQTEN